MKQLKLTKSEIVKDNRHSEEIDVSKEPTIYFVKLAYEYYGDATRDNSIAEMISLGMEIERGEA